MAEHGASVQFHSYRTEKPKVYVQQATAYLGWNPGDNNNIKKDNPADPSSIAGRLSSGNVC